MNVKPVNLGAVKPVAVKPVAVKPVTIAPPAQESVTPPVPSQDAVFDDIFGGTGESKETKPVATELPKEERQAEIKNAVTKAKNKAKPKAEKEEDDEEDDEEAPKKTTKKPAKKFEGPRQVIVYGQLLWTEEDNSVTLEQMRKKIADEYHFPEFSAGRTQMTIDEETGIVVPVIKFEKKG